MSFLDNFGRRDNVQPASLQGYPDQESKPLMVFLAVTPMRGASAKSDQSYWSISWEIGRTASKDTIHRRGGLTQSQGQWANWSTRSWALCAREFSEIIPVPIKSLPHAHRQLLENIINNQQVRKPGDPQVWCRDVLEAGAQAGLFTPAEVQMAVQKARAILPVRA